MPWLCFLRFPRSSRKKPGPLGRGEGQLSLAEPRTAPAGVLAVQELATLGHPQGHQGLVTPSCPQGPGRGFAAGRNGFAGDRGCLAAWSGTAGSRRALPGLVPTLSLLSSRSFVHKRVGARAPLPSPRGWVRVSGDAAAARQPRSSWQAPCAPRCAHAGGWLTNSVLRPSSHLGDQFRVPLSVSLWRAVHLRTPRAGRRTACNTARGLKHPALVGWPFPK